jgi:ABC-type Na+ efflux pump permease subunit
MPKKKKKKKNKFDIKEFLKSTKFLTVVFILLLILVIVLAILCGIKSKEYETGGFANISFSLGEDNKPIEFGINAATLAQTDEYIFKVTNYKGKKINKKKKDYTVIIENNTDCVISVTINDLNDNVMLNQESTELKDTLKAKEKEAVYYHVKVKSFGELEPTDLINIKID